MWVCIINVVQYERFVKMTWLEGMSRDVESDQMDSSALGDAPLLYDLMASIGGVKAASDKSEVI